MILNNIISKWENKFLEINKLLDVSFKEYIKDKNVLLIGPSDFLEEKNLKDFIDSSDIVIRINLGYKLTLDENNKDYGTKTNVVYLNQKIRYFGNNYQNKIIEELENKENNEENNEENNKNNKLEYIVLNCCGLPKLIDNYKHENDYTHIIHSDLDKLKKILNINTNLYMGTQIIIELLACKPSHLILIGMDFYNNNCCKTYIENNKIFDETYKLNENEKNIRIKNHISINNNFDFNLFAFIYGIKDMLPSLKNINIVLDSYLNKLIDKNKLVHNNF